MPFNEGRYIELVPARTVNQGVQAFRTERRRAATDDALADEILSLIASVNQFGLNKNELTGTGLGVGCHDPGTGQDG